MKGVGGVTVLAKLAAVGYSSEQSSGLRHEPRTAGQPVVYRP